MKNSLAYLFTLCAVAAFFFDGFLPSCVIFALTIIGYSAMPFFAQFLVDGFFLTRNTYKYSLRLAFCAYFSQAVYLLVFLLWPGSPHPTRLNIGFTWLIAMGVLVAVEFLVSLPRDRIASMNLLDANRTTNSTRFDVVLSSEDANNLPRGLKVPRWPKTTFHALAIFIIALCMLLITFLPLTMSLMSIMCVLVFYFLHRWKIDSRILVATIVYSAFAACYAYAYYRMTGTFSWQWTSLVGFILCLLIPNRRRRKNTKLYRLRYLILPAGVGIIAFIAYLIS
ncbi:MAG: hypothetical protein J6Y08_10820 [Clostridiales bacterium]|nr:hypothetical protein [Clostridiales bacterium]